MTDQSIRAFNKQSGTNPITQGGRVVVNGFPDHIEVADRKISLQNNRSLYKGPVTDAHYHMARGEIALARRSQNGESRYTATGDSTVYVTTALNGAGSSSQTREDLIEQLWLAGIVQLWIEYDSSNKQSDVAGAIVIGGLFTIPNMGPERIVAGDLVFWDLPDPNLAAIESNPHIDGTPDDKILPFMRRYVPSEHAATKSAVFRHLATLIGLDNSDSSVDSVMRSERAKVAGYGAAFYNALKMGVLLGLAAIEESNGRQAGEDGLVNIAKNLGLVGTRQKQEQATAANFDKIFVQKLFGMSIGNDGSPISGTTSTLLFAAAAQGKYDESPAGLAKSELSKRQASVVDELLTGLSGMRHFVGRRVFGVARGTGDPGDDIDVDVGVYEL